MNGDESLHRQPGGNHESRRVEQHQESFLAQQRQFHESFLAQQQQSHESFLVQQRQLQERFLAQQQQHQERFDVQQRQSQESFDIQQRQHQERFDAQQRQLQERFDAQQRQLQERFDVQQRQLQERFDVQQRQLLNNYHAARSNPDLSSATAAVPRLHQQDDSSATAAVPRLHQQDDSSATAAVPRLHQQDDSSATAAVPRLHQQEQQLPSNRISASPSNPSQVKPAATTESLTESFVLPLFASTEANQSACMIDIVQHKYQENGLNAVVDPNKEWWFASEYASEGDSYVELRKLMNQAASEQGFQVWFEKDMSRALTTGEIPYFVRCSRRRSHKCKFRFTIHWCPEQLRFKFRKLNGMCNWTHTCQITTPHHQITHPTTSPVIPAGTPQQENTNSEVLSSGIVYCKLDKALLEIHKVLKDDLATKVRHVGRGNRKGKESGHHYQKDGDANWPISDHEHHNNQIYSGLAATSTKIVTGSGKKQRLRMYDPKKDEMATLVDKKPGWLLENCSNIDPGNEQSGYTLHPIFQYFDDNNFPGIRAGSYHKAVGDQVNGTTPELSCYRGHCDVCYFDNVIFTVVQFWTWVFIAVPKGKSVPAHSNDDFEEWRHGRKEIHGCRLNEADQEKVNKYYTKFKQEAPGEMNKKYEETIDDVDVYAFLLEPGGYLAFSAHILYHSTLTTYQTRHSFRELLALHGFQWHRTTG